MTNEELEKELRDTQSHFINDVTALREEYGKNFEKSSNIINSCIEFIKKAEEEIEDSKTRSYTASYLSAASCVMSALTFIILGLVLIFSR